MVERERCVMSLVSILKQIFVLCLRLHFLRLSNLSVEKEKRRFLFFFPI